MIKEFLSKYDRKTLIHAGVALLVYILWVIWLGNYWFLLGIPVVFDMYLTRKVNWSPWKKREGKNNIIIEWVDALIFAVIAVTIINIFLFQNYKIPTGSMEKSLQIGDHLYVSKVAYGPRLPMTPLALPFMQHTIPGTKAKSYIDWPQWDYKRIAGFGKIKRWDPVVFNFPEGDTVCFERSNETYYAIIRKKISELKQRDISSNSPLKSESEYYKIARDNIWNQYTMVVRPIDKMDNYIKRCVAVPGDSLQVINGDLYINGELEPYIGGRQTTYKIQTNGTKINPRRVKEMGIYEDDFHYNGMFYWANISEDMVKDFSEYRNITSIDKEILDSSYSMINDIFPYDSLYPWNLDQFGPIYIPKEGVTVDITMETLPFYKRIISHYEGNALEVKNSTIYINGEPATTYTFKMSYYWMMGDNRHSSLDSRYWGYVPENHIIGKPRFIWLSVNKEKRFPTNIQLKRMFRKIN
ncbi:MAG: signal peptidase I [Bacteroidales bacterium]|nr:signal peptidase I [Bacteroidales bacterium]MBN2820508.1 signal peptidase I [Bacteroidales bacterium]